MNLATFSTADDFLRQAQSCLERNEAANSLMLGIVLRLQRFPERIERAPYLAVVEDERGIAFAALMTPPWNLVLSSERQDIGAALEMIARDLFAHKWEVTGAIGPAQIADTFAEIWARISGKRSEINRRERLFELRYVNRITYSRGRMRFTEERDANLVTEWALAFQKEALGAEHIADISAMMRRRIGDREIYVWDDGAPVSMAAKTRPTRNGMSVSLVYTPPESRRKGYATSLIARLSQSLLDSGCKYCALFTDLTNPTSNHIYQEIGYQPVCDFDEYRFE